MTADELMDLVVQYGAARADSAYAARDGDERESVRRAGVAQDALGSIRTEVEHRRDQAVRSDADHRTMDARATELEAALALARHAAGRLSVVLVASAHLLDKPFTNAPGLSPWSRGVSPALNGLRAALGMDHAPVELCTAVSGDGAHCTSVANHPNLTLAGMPFNHGNPEAGVFWNDLVEGDHA